MKSLKELKEKMLGKVESYEFKENNKNLRLSISFGTKVVEIHLNEITKYTHEIGEVNREYENSTPLLKIVSKLEGINDSHAIVKFSRGTVNYYQSNSNTFVDSPYSKQMIIILLEYWETYMQVKGLSALFIDESFASIELSKHFSEIMSDSQTLQDLHAYSPILNKPEKVFVTHGYIHESYKKELNIINTFHEEIESLINDNKTFTYEYEARDRSYYLENKKYYYANVYFYINVSKEGILVSGEEIGEQMFHLKKGIGKELLEHVSEQMKISNLIHPPIKNLKNLILHLGAWFDDEHFERKIVESDIEIGEGQIEEECVELIEVFQAHKSIADYQLEQYKDVYKRVTNKQFSYYCIRTDKYYWHILIKSGFDFWLYPSNTNEYPDYIHNKLSTVMKKLTS